MIRCGYAWTAIQSMLSPCVIDILYRVLMSYVEPLYFRKLIFVVVTIKYGETYSAGPVHQILNHGYLAVDFFFVLSGFVIGYAYDDRWDRMF